VNAGGNSAYSAIAGATTLDTPPVAPTGLAAAAQSSSQIDLTWTDNATNEGGYRVERCTGASCSDFAEIATLPANSVGYQNTGLSAATTYVYRVRAVNTAGNSAYSNTSSSTTAPIAPSVTTNAATSVTETGFTMNGSVNPNGVETSAYFEWSTDPLFNSPSTTTSNSVGSGSSLVPISATVTSNLCGTTFYYRAVAVNTTPVTSRGTASSATLSACTTPATPTATGPGTTTSPGPTVAAGTVTMSWTAVGNATYYNVIVRDEQANTVVVNQNPTTNSYGVIFIGGGHQYSWTVTACNSAGCNSTYTVPLFFTTPP
jgi:hypothetical protein